MSPKPTLRYLRVGMSCCGDDWLQAESSRYDLERLGCLPTDDPALANLLILQGSLNEKLSHEVVGFYEKMQQPRYVLAIGTCACGGGLFPTAIKDQIPVNIYVTGCPPRPEAIMNGVISLREVQS